jgi:hypothetical protein
MCSFEVFPDFKEIDRYTGVLKARNLEIFKERLEKAGMLDQAENFLRASGALSLLCHREGVEAALRTPGFGGFQMLDLQDFSGQGTALVGMLNVFMESKGIVAPEAWREFCCETVPLLWMSKYVWTNGKTFRARIRAAHYGPSDLNGQSLRWTIASGTGSGTAARILACGETPPMLIPTGTVSEIDLIHAELASVRTAQKLTLVLELPGTDYRNRYEFWVYPEREWPAAPEDILIARELSAEVSERLGNGGKVLLLPDPAKLANTGTVAHTGTVTNTVAMSFQSSFWSPMFRMGDGIGPSGKETPGTQGILCDPDHPLFKNFPTDHHTNWQWWHLIKNSRPVILDATAANYRPILQVVDTFARNHKLGLIMEAKCFGGKLLICSIDLLALRQRPEARQLMISVLKYMGSEDFDPRVELSADRIEGLLG